MFPSIKVETEAESPHKSIRMGSIGTLINHQVTPVLNEISNDSYEDEVIVSTLWRVGMRVP